MLPNIVLTSDQWFQYLNGVDKYHIRIMDHPAGWNAHNLHHEWYVMKITQEEFMDRLKRSKFHTERKSDLNKKGLKGYEYHA